MLKIENLRKKYRGGEKYAVDGISLEVREGEVFGFLGPNGAGKSTTIKCAAGILPFDEGRISICGKDLRTETIAAKMQMGYVSDNHAVYDKLTAREYLNFISDIYGVGDSDRKRRADEYMQMFGLTDAFDGLCVITDYNYSNFSAIVPIAACMSGSAVSSRRGSASLHRCFASPAHSRRRLASSTGNCSAGHALHIGTIAEKLL